MCCCQKYRPLKPEEISLIPSGKIFVSKKIDGELWLAHINKMEQHYLLKVEDL